MVATYEPIATTTLGSAASSIDFTSIPATFTDLRLVIIGSGSTAGTAFYGFRFNNDSGSNYSVTEIRGNGSTAGSLRYTSETQGYIDPASQIPSSISFGTLDVFSYAGSTYKTSLATYSADTNGSGLVEWSVNLWQSTSAINQLTVITGGAATFAAGTTATLYGILKA